MTKRKPSVILHVTPVDENHQVVTVSSPDGHDRYRKRPCPQCPWRLDTTGRFPAEAFRVSANTAWDIPDAVEEWSRTGIKPGTFSCHMAGDERPATCAGFLLRGAQNSFAVRTAKHAFTGVKDHGIALHPSYRAMAIANGVPADDPALEKCHDGGLGKKRR